MSCPDLTVLIQSNSDNKLIQFKYFNLWNKSSKGERNASPMPRKLKSYCALSQVSSFLIDSLPITLRKSKQKGLGDCLTMSSNCSYEH